NQIRATAVDGCRWTLGVNGNTAELLPRQETCAAGGTIGFWALASDGHRAAAVVSRVDPTSGTPCTHLLSAGKLTRR
ncbi:MAG TPA: hypothetical protein VMT50_12160, partial [Steroidobacteraceae bacterium]|nr:hypothetical protein [Steroidobacteraceae bacterium]